MDKAKHFGKKEFDVEVPIPQIEPGKAGVGDLMNHINDLTVLVNALADKAGIKTTKKKDTKSS